MTTSIERPTSPAPLPRCCDGHPDWPTLASHLLVEFPEATISDVVREVGAARNAVEHRGLQREEELAVGELVVRHQLSMLTGHRIDIARLDQHSRQRGPDPAG